MEEQKKHWTNKVKRVSAETSEILTRFLNDFYADKFVIATQIWSPVQSGTKVWIAIVYYKVPPKSD